MWGLFSNYWITISWGFQLGLCLTLKFSEDCTVIEIRIPIFGISIYRWLKTEE